LKKCVPTNKKIFRQVFKVMIEGLHIIGKTSLKLNIQSLGAVKL
jgi:hypothetical protein